MRFGRVAVWAGCGQLTVTEWVVATGRRSSEEGGPARGYLASVNETSGCRVPWDLAVERL